MTQGNLPLNSKTPKAQLAGFLAKYSPNVRTIATAALKKLRRRLPGAIELVYDNYNALAIGFSPSERASEAILSIAVYPRWVSLFFLQSGTKLPDPKGLLKGSGTKVRHIVLEAAEDLDKREVQALIREALMRASRTIDPTAKNRIVIKAISAKQRPRRPSAKK